MHKLCGTLSTVARPFAAPVNQPRAARLVTRMGVSGFLACHRNPQLTSIDTYVLRYALVPLAWAKGVKATWQYILSCVLTG